jgi:hypothetical protein
LASKGAPLDDRTGPARALGGREPSSWAVQRRTRRCILLVAAAEKNRAARGFSPNGRRRQWAARREGEPAVYIGVGLLALVLIIRLLIWLL